jgi:hypothetical protein
MHAFRRVPLVEQHLVLSDPEFAAADRDLRQFDVRQTAKQGLSRQDFGDGVACFQNQDIPLALNGDFGAALSHLKLGSNLTIVKVIKGCRLSG